jgi:hypothetical protein
MSSLEIYSIGFLAGLVAGMTIARICCVWRRL